MPSAGEAIPIRTIRSSLLLIALALAALPATSAPSAACASPVHDPIVGLACPVPGGFVSILPDGTQLFTHGPDPIPAPRAPSPALADPGVECVSESEPHIIALYATPRDVPLATSTAAPARREIVVASILHANAIVYHNAMEHGVEMRWKMLCDEDGLPYLEDVRLSLRSVDVDFGSLTWEIMDRGYGHANEKVLIFYEGTTQCGGCGGISYIPGGDQWGPSNWNNYGYWSYSAIFIANYGATFVWPIDEVVLHEETHAMGGVQLSAPHTSGAWHCNDGWDIMCYADGGSSSLYANTCQPYGHTFVALTQPYDCGNDDYFHPTPAPGSYLDTHWNVGAAYNRFLARG